jgi:hypothetical protein
VALPPHLLPVVKNHIHDHAAMGRDGLLFPAGHGEQLAPSTLYRVFYPARKKAGREDLRFHEQHPSPSHRQALRPRALRRGDEPALRVDRAADRTEEILTRIRAEI